MATPEPSCRLWSSALLHQDTALIGPVLRLAAFGTLSFLNVASCRVPEEIVGR
jgi:hypothetical protein